mgnify:CR=1 FL=1
MRFCQQLNAWMVLTGCRASELCARSGVAAPSLSRYRAGERTPGRDSAALDGLCRGLAELAQEQLPALRGADAHFTVMLSDVDRNLLKRLGINVTCEPRYETKGLYHK